MRLNRKLLATGFFCGLWLVGSGCGGIIASGAMSPASFFLPGLLKADPPKEQPDHALPKGAPVKELAKN